MMEAVDFHPRAGKPFFLPAGFLPAGKSRYSILFFLMSANQLADDPAKIHRQANHLSRLVGKQ